MTTTSSKANSRIAKNTLFLYIRKILSLIIALYTSRVLLQTLGLDDFGLYGLVGSIVILFNSLRSLFASSIQRFLNTEKKGSNEVQNEIFSMGVSIHIGIAVLFFMVVEIAGYIMIPHLNFLPEKTSIAFWVLQFSILSAVVAILTVPYDALMMAKEQFDAIAGFSLLDALLRLGAIFLLVMSPINKVVTYSILLFGIAILIRMLNALYCRKKFKDIAHYRFIKNKKLMMDMTHFASWNFFGNLGFSITNQGLNFVLNLFGGVTANAARTIAYQVNDNMRSFVVDISLAFTPQSMMSYKENRIRFYNLQFFSAKISSAIFLVLVFPIYLLTEPVLNLWLGECPVYAVSFIHGLIFYSMVRNWHGPIDIAFKSANRMKIYQLVEITIMFLNLPISWIFLKLGAPLYSIFVIMTAVELINLAAILLVANKQVNFPVKEFIRRVIIPTVAAIIILVFCYGLFNYFKIELHSVIKLLIIGILGVAFALIITIVVVFDRVQLQKIVELIKKR